MKKIVTLIYSSSGWKTDDEIFEHLKSLAPDELKKYHSSIRSVVAFEANSPELDIALEWLKKNNYFLGMFRETIYTASELKKVEYFQLLPCVALEMRGTGEEDYGTQFINGCPICGKEKKRVGNLKMPYRFLKNRKFALARSELFVSAEMAEKLTNSELTGFHIGPEVLSSKGEKLPQTFYSFEIDSILPPLSDTVLWNYSHAYRCGHPTVYVRSELEYERDKMKEAKDFNLTSEYLNNDFAQELVISAKAKKLLRDEKIVGNYKPVILLP